MNNIQAGQPNMPAYLPGFSSLAFFAQYSNPAAAANAARETASPSASTPSSNAAAAVPTSLDHVPSLNNREGMVRMHQGTGAHVARGSMASLQKLTQQLHTAAQGTPESLIDEQLA